MTVVHQSSGTATWLIVGWVVVAVVNAPVALNWRGARDRANGRHRRWKHRYPWLFRNQESYEMAVFAGSIGGVVLGSLALLFELVALATGHVG